MRRFLAWATKHIRDAKYRIRVRIWPRDATAMIDSDEQLSGREVKATIVIDFSYGRRDRKRRRGQLWAVVLDGALLGAVGSESGPVARSA